MVGQVTSRVSEEIEAALNRWAADDGRTRAELIREILAEAVEARKEGRARFDKPQELGPQDMQQLFAVSQRQQIEFGRVLDHYIKRDAALVKSAKADTANISEARTAIVFSVAAKLHQMQDEVVTRISNLPAEQVAALTTSPAFIDIVETLRAQDKALVNLSAATKQWFEQPRTQTNYMIWDQNWSGRKVAAALIGAWLLSVGSYFFVAKALPSSWLAVRSASLVLDEDDGQAVCALVRYRRPTDYCTFKANSGTARRRR